MSTTIFLIKGIHGYLMRLGFLVLLLAVAGCGGERGAWKEAEATDSLEAYRLFLIAYPEASVRDLAMEKIASLEVAGWDRALLEGTVEAFDNFVCRFPESSYRLDLGGFRVDVRRRIEDGFVDELVGNGFGDRFILDLVDVNTEYEGGRFQIKTMVHDGHERLLLSTEFPDDWFHVEIQFNNLVGGIGSMINKIGDGNVLIPGLQSVHYADGTVWRISGAAKLSLSIEPDLNEEYVFQGSEQHPLSFYLAKGVGAVYLHGFGSIENADGETVFLADRDTNLSISDSSEPTTISTMPDSC